MFLLLFHCSYLLTATLNTLIIEKNDWLGYKIKNKTYLPEFIVYCADPLTINFCSIIFIFISPFLVVKQKYKINNKQANKHTTAQQKTPYRAYVFSYAINLVVSAQEVNHALSYQLASWKISVSEYSTRKLSSEIYTFAMKDNSTRDPTVVG